VTNGTRLGSCPYYSSRSAIRSSELVALPYNMLLHAEMREAIGINLRGNVVIIDEAHNLAESISSLYSISVSATQLAQAHSQLSSYLERYLARLKATNLQYIRRILLVVNALHKCLTDGSALASQSGGSASSTTLMTINSFLFMLRIDHINMFKLGAYLQGSDLVRKVHDHHTSES